MPKSTKKIENLATHRGTLGGSLKITGNEHAFAVALWDKFARFARAYPEVALELDSQNRFADIVAERFDAGIRLGEFVERDMIAVRVSPDLQMAAVAAPELLSRIDAPETPHDLATSPCLNLRLPTLGNILPWEFSNPASGKTVKIKPASGFTATKTVCCCKPPALAWGLPGCRATWWRRIYAQTDCTKSCLTGRCVTKVITFTT